MKNTIGWISDTAHYKVSRFNWFACTAWKSEARKVFGVLEREVRIVVWAQEQSTSCSFVPGTRQDNGRPSATAASEAKLVALKGAIAGLDSMSCFEH